MSSPWGDGTRSVRAGEGVAVPGAPLRPSPVFAAPYHLGDQPPGWQGADGYARPDNPTLRVFERAVGELDGGDCLSFASGMAAISSAVLALAGPGDRVVTGVHHPGPVAEGGGRFRGGHGGPLARGPASRECYSGFASRDIISRTI